MRIPPGMAPDQAAAVVKYLQENPDAARAAWQQAQQVLQRPGMANMMLAGASPAGAAAGAGVFAALKDDPELAEVFEDVKANGMGALQKYWDDTDLMSKISSKLRAMQIAKQQELGQQQQQQQAAGDEGSGGDGKVPSKHAPAAPAARPGASARPGAAPRTIESLHDAARWGDAPAAKRLIAAGADVNGRNERGIPALGVAVGFNQKELVQLLLDSGADVSAADGKGSTALHYAAGYGRREVAALLLDAGADLNALNEAKQKPVDVAKINGEKKMVEWLREQAAERASA